ncbi:MAG: type II toxin-antitoxin system RelE/ParE family toxin [Candidatus Nanohaloarchaea archaeon]
MEVRLHPDVRQYLDELQASDTERCEESLEKLGEDTYRSGPRCDIKKLKGKDREMYRLRVGDHRFEYFIDDDKVWIVEAFRRGRHHYNLYPFNPIYHVRCEACSHECAECKDQELGIELQTCIYNTIEV